METELMRNRQEHARFDCLTHKGVLTKISLFVALACFILQAQHLFAVKSRIEWPTQARVLSTNDLPMVVTGVSQGFLGVTFHIEHFDPGTTVLEGFIDLTNHTDASNSVTLCLRGDSISYHMEMLDADGNWLMDPQGAVRNWNAQVFQFAPGETKRERFRVRLNSYFEIKPGICQLLFVFDERLIRKVEDDRYTRKAWSCERIILRCN